MAELVFAVRGAKVYKPAQASRHSALVKRVVSAGPTVLIKKVAPGGSAMLEACIYDGLRTPFGRHPGSFSIERVH